MKKFIKRFLLLTFFAINGLGNIVNAQNIQAYSDATIIGSGFSYNVQLSITPIENNEVNHSGGWIVRLNSVNPDSKGYYYQGKTNRYFSCSELGNICNPSKFDMVQIRVRYQCDNNAEQSIVFYGTDREERIVVRQKPNTKCTIELVSVTVKNNTDEPIYRKRINEIEYPQQITSTINNNNPSNSINPVSQSGSSSEVYLNGQGMPASASSANPLQIPNSNNGNPLPYNSNSGSSALDSFNQGYQQGQQIAEIATGIVDLFAPSPAQLQKRAARTAEYERLREVEKNIERKEKEERFVKLYYYPLIEEAKNGDENARMNLYFSSDILWCWKLVPQREEWLIKAYKNNNFDAILEVAKESKDRYSILENAAKLGSVDAMVLLGEWFNKKETVLGNAFGGENAKTALYWFEEAAEKNNPAALYYLGMIYTYGMTEDVSNGNNYKKKLYVKYNIERNEKLAFDYFSKAIENQHNVSLYSKANYSGGFRASTYKELANMHKKGKFIPKDKNKAKEFESNYENYEFIRF